MRQVEKKNGHHRSLNERGDKMIGSVIGIEIGNNTIKLIEVARKGAILRVERFSLMDTPKEAMINGVINNMPLITATIAKELVVKKYKAKRAIIVIQSTSIIIRKAIVDKQPQKILKQIIMMRPEEYLPVEPSQYQIDYKVIREFRDKEQQKQELLLVAAPHHIVLPMLNIVASLKLKPVLISVPSEALVTAFATQDRIVYDTHGGVLVMDIGGVATATTIFANSQATLTRMIEFGINRINEVINDSLEAYDPDDISQEARARYEEQVQELIRPQIHYNLIVEVERILQFYYSRFDSTPIKKIYLIGGGTDIQGIRNHIRDALNIPTFILNEFCKVIERPQIGFEPYRKFFVNILGAINSV